jgi:phosphoesterase RecJ-like protein
VSESSLSVKEVLSLFDQAQTVAICGHVNPDGDALGSCLALAAMLRQKGCDVTCLLAQDQPAPALYSFLKDYQFSPASCYQGTPDLFVALDAPVLGRLGAAAAALKRAKVSLAIDHHPDYEGYADYYHGSATASATGLLIWQLLRGSNIMISREMAEYCYVALMTDTGRFAFQNTHINAFLAAAQMMEAGVSPSLMFYQVYQSKSQASLQLVARLIDRMRFSQNGRVAYSWVTEADFSELDINRDETEGLPDILRSLKGVEVAVLLRAEGSSVRVNLRAKNECDVGEIARRFGGGGHAAAAGFTLNTSIEEVLDQVMPVLGGLKCLESGLACD